MNRLEKIKKQRAELATEAALAFKAHQSMDLNTRGIIDTQRAELHSSRESKRTMPEIAAFAIERRIGGKDESKDLPPNASAKTFGIPVARIYEIGNEVEPKGFGTGFLVAPNILITNNHVFPSAESAEGCAANFGYERNPENQKIVAGSTFGIEPEKFFYTHKELDFSLVYVTGQSLQNNLDLSSLGYRSLIETKGKITKSSPINIVQYPNGGIKKYTTEENFVTEIDDSKGFIFYTTDTMQGSSGSPCANIFWEVAALHFSSVPRVNASGQWLTKNDEIFDSEKMSDEEVDWVANAGISISKIVSHLKTATVSTEQRTFIDTILKHSGDPLKETVPAAPETKLLPTTNQNFKPMENGITLNFNGTTTVHINTQTKEASVEAPSMINKELNVSVEAKERFDEDYSSREGYKENFIRGFKVPVPQVEAKREKELYKNFGAKVPYIVPYHHYSLVMNKKRRMCMWTACNVNYDPATRDNRSRTQLGNGAWRFDKRIPEKYQIGAKEFYDPATLVDKGHIVRRDDNCWWSPLANGKTDSLGIEYGNADTFHWTNCTPQHEAFNRDTPPYKGIGLWGILENAVKDQLDDLNDENKDYGQKACVLAGPILTDDDPEYNDIQYPLAFWKVFAIRSKSEGNLVYGFMLSQEDKVEETGLEKEARPRWSAKVKALQKSLKEIEKASGIVFHESLHEYDVLNNSTNKEELKADLSNLKKKKKAAASK